LIPLGLFLLTIPITALLGRRISGLRTQQQASTDERMKYVRELISAIRIIKYYAWETPFKQNIANHRSYEVGKIKSILLSRSMMMAILSNVPALSMGLTFFIYALSNSLDVTKVFTSSSLMNLLRTPCLYLPVLVANLSQYTVALGRITRFVSTKELPKRRERPSADPAAKFEDATFSWFDDETPATTPLDPDTIPMGPRRAASYRAGLHNITTTIKRGELVMIVGTVGSGKRCAVAFVRT
jgi:ABC-type multidrug transport system fused ATPase/permease subunit